MIVPSLRGGGLERMVADLCGELVKGGDRPRVFSLGGLGVFAKGLEEQGVQTVDCRSAHVHLRGIPIPLINALRDFHPDLMHAHSGTWYSAVVGNLFVGVPLVFTEHGRVANGSHLSAALDRWCARRTTVTVGVSEAAVESLRGLLRPSQPVEVVENCIDLSTFSGHAPRSGQVVRDSWNLSASDVVLISVGRLESIKNQQALLDAMSIVSLSAERVHLVLIGSGSLESNLRKRALDLGVQGRVVFAGFQNDIHSALAAADIYVNSSLSEGLPLSILEAMAAGLPVVAPDVGGIEAALGKPPAGIIVDRPDPHLLAEALVKLVEDDNAREELSRLAKTRAKRYDLTIMARAYSSLYRSIMDDGHG